MTDKAPAAGGPDAARRRPHPQPHNGAAAAGRLVIECPACHTSIVVEEPAVRAVGAGADPVVLRLQGPMPAPELPLDDVVHHLESELARRALEQTGGVKLHAAELLGMKYSTFWELLRRLGVDVDDAGEVRGGTSGDATADTGTDGHTGADQDPGADDRLALDRVDRIDLDLGTGDRALHLEVPVPPDSGLLTTAVNGLRTGLARHAMERCDGNLTCAAERLGMKYTTFHSLVQRLGVRE